MFCNQSELINADAEQEHSNKSDGKVSEEQMVVNACINLLDFGTIVVPGPDCTENRLPTGGITAGIHSGIFRFPFVPVCKK